jgi:alpha-mannosidase
MACGKPGMAHRGTFSRHFQRHGGSYVLFAGRPALRERNNHRQQHRGWDGKGDVWPGKTEPSSTIYSWVMNNHWFTNTPLTQEGPVSFRYRIAVHGPYDAAAAHRFGRAECQPLIVVAADKNPITEPLIRVSGDRVVVTILKSTAEGRGLIVRLRSFSEKDARVTLSWPARQPRSVTFCTADEERGSTEVGNDVVVPAMGFTWLRAEW